MKRLFLVLPLLAAALSCSRSGGPAGSTPASGAARGEAPPPPPDVVVEPRADDRGLSVVAARPQDLLAGMNRPTITFSKPVVAMATLEESDKADASRGIRLEPKAPGAWRWLGSSSVEFVPSAQLPYSTQYAVTVPKGLKALDGTSLQADYSFQFHTPLVEVQDWLSSPETSECAWSVPEQAFKVVVNQPLADPARSFFFELKSGGRVEAKVVASVNLQDERLANEAAQADPRLRRRFDRAAPEALTFKNQQTRYELKPVRPLPLATPFAVALDLAARGAQGPLQPVQGWSRRCSTYGPMRVTAARRCQGWGDDDERRCTRGPPVLVFTNSVGPIAELKKRLTLTPEPAWGWDEKSGDEDLGAGRSTYSGEVRVRLPARLKPGTAYKLELAAGVPDAFGQTAPAFQASFSTDDLEPSLFVGVDRALLEATGDGRLPAQATNLKTLAADLWELSPQQVAQRRFCQGNRGCQQPPAAAPDAQIRDTLTYPKNEPRIHPVDLRAAFKNGKKTGLVLARISSPEAQRGDREREPQNVLAQVTDLVVHAKVGLSSGAVWVTSVSKGEPVANAKITVYDRNGQQRHEAVTDAQGLAALPGLDLLDPSRNQRAWEEPRVLVAAALGDDLGVGTTHWTDQARADNTSMEFDGLVARPLGLIFSDRGLYRPGDTVHLKGILRRKSGVDPAGLSTPKEGTAVEVQTKAPDGRVVEKRTVKLSRYGTFSFDVTVPADGRLGTYDLYAEQPDGDPKGPWYGSFRVAEYRAPTFRVDVLTDPKELTAGEELKASVSARYLFGGAMTGAQASWSVIRVTTAFDPPGHEGFSFGRQTWSGDEEEPGHDSSFFASGKATVDKSGTVQIAAGKVEALADRPATYTLEAEVQDVSRQAQAGRVQLTVHPAAFYLGLGKQSLFAQAGQPVKVPVVAADAKGKRVAGVGVKLAALERQWHAVRKKGVGGVFQSVTEAVDTEIASCTLTTAAEEKSCDLKLEKAGFYTLRAEAKDGQGRLALSTTGIYALGPGFAAWQRGDTPRVELVADKPAYAVGDVAKVLIKSPYPECNALVTIEREGVFEKRLLKLTGTATAIEVPVTEAMVPNVYVGAVLQRARVEQGGIEPGDDPGRPSVRVGFAELSVGTQVKRLAVEVKPARTDYRPREKVAVEVTVKDSAGKPRQAEVTVYAVDEGVLRLAGYAVPDPVNEMYPHRGLGVALGEPLLSLVRRQKFGEKGEVQPGGGGGREGGGAMRGKFLTTSLWTTVEAGADGKARVEFELPDNLTTFRLMAVAVTDLDRFGSGQSEVRVSLPLLVLPALPRFARVGDTFEAGVVVNAKGLAAERSEVTVSAEVAGAAGLAEGQPAEQKVTVEEGVAREVRFRLAGKAAGSATLRFRASAQGDPGRGGPFKDGVEQVIPVQLPVGLEAVATYGDTDKKREEGLVPPAGVRPDVGGLTVTLASTALGGLGEAMDQLMDYPYGCLEQLSSRLVPFVAVREVQKVFGLDAGKNEASAARADELNRLLSDLTGRGAEKTPLDADAVVRTTVGKILQLQTPGGGFRYWPGEGCTYAWPSIYATLALHRAREAGYPVDKGALDRAAAFVAQKAEGKASCPWEAVGPETRVFALQVLARMGRPRPADYDELYAEKDKLPLFAKALLADAMAIGKGKRPRALALLQDVLDQAQETAAGVHFAETNPGSYAPLFSSDTRTTGMVLQTLADLNPTHPFVGKIARYLVGARKGGTYRNTQEAAYALMGLTEVVRARERQAPDFTAKVALGGKELVAQPFKGRSLAVITKRLAMSELKAAAGDGKKALPFTFEVAGSGTLTYGALLRYAPAQLPLTARDEGLFVQRWIEPYDAPGRAATTFNAGELVRVRLRVATRMERHYVAIDVPLPAGFEAVDTQLATTARNAREPNEEGGEEGGEEGYDAEGAGRYGFWSPFVFSEKRDDRVVYFSDILPPGVHVQSFVARATTPGKFLLKAAQAEEMYTPEVFGRSEARSVTIAAQRPVSQR